MQRIYDYFRQKLDDAFYAIIYHESAVININIPDCRPVQIIGVLKSNRMKILESFDLTHSQIAFDGSNIIYTQAFIDAISTKTTKITKGSIHAYRLIKSFTRGYSIMKPEACYIKNDFHEYTPSSNKVPANTDSYRYIGNLQDDIAELSKNEIVLKNLNKNYIPSITTNCDTALKNIIHNYTGDKIQIVLNNNKDEPIEKIAQYLNFNRSLW
ncbi:MAG: hypothetical protein Hyperionvirus9_52 [Hyperionvirus sp.]|uniref:Uncharacterized protein n=1 Tax=Hyperionvirus sp. TaxID=2487770 RepID=A0A3G5A8S6_9VIRU|nr:MAG: hypothetical protein Hyperionvirus9_52 [Hyperionvirus sp.]